MVKRKVLSHIEVSTFRSTVYAYFRQNGRALPWRETDDPYRILVSEIMLQQTQVERVLLKYHQFIERFPNITSLARAELSDVLAVWLGLGYNRRAAALHRIAQRVVAEFKGEIPDSPELLRTFPGIGEATAGALVTFAFHRPAAFIETNIRRVFLHFFFPRENAVRDREILPLVEQTLDRERVRTWYYALMDYGAMLKTREPNPNRRSAHHHTQAPFQGSDRQIRGMILKLLVGKSFVAEQKLVKAVGKGPARVKKIIDRLVQEGFLDRKGDELTIASGRDQKNLGPAGAAASTEVETKVLVDTERDGQVRCSIARKLPLKG